MNEMIRLLLLRILICTWAIPISFFVLLPMFYLMSGRFKSELDNVNSLVHDLWNGTA